MESGRCSLEDDNMKTKTAFFGLIVAALALASGMILFESAQTDADYAPDEIAYASDLTTFSGTASELWPADDVFRYDLEGPVIMMILPDSKDGYDYEVYKTLSNGLTVEVENGMILTTVAETGYTNIVLKRTDANGQAETRTLFVIVTTLTEDGVPIYGSSQDYDLAITPDSKSIRVGQTFDVTLTILPEEFNDYLRYINWSMHKGGVATVSNQGVFGTSYTETVTGIAKGSDEVVALAQCAIPDSTQDDGYLRYTASAYSAVTVYEGYIVTWMSQDGNTTLATTEVQEGMKPTYPNSNPTKPATDQYTYSFAGWATSDSQETGTSASALPVVTADKTYYAAFSKTTRSYTVTINSGENGSVSSSSVTVPYGTAISVSNGNLVIGNNTIAPQPDEGYKLSAWSQVPDTVTGPLTVTAYFEIKTYTLTFVIEGSGALAITGGNHTDTTLSDVPHGSMIRQLGKDLYIGDGMKVAAIPGEGRTLEWSFGSDTVESDMTITAIMNPKQFTVTFQDTGDTTLPNATVTYTSKYKNGENWPATPTKTGYTFAGWFTEGGAQIDGNDTVAIESDITLYGHWTANQYTITFVTEGASIPSVTIQYGQEYSAATGWPANPTRSGYVFAGWYLDYSLTDPLDEHSSYLRASDTTLYAKWNAQSTTYTNTVTFLGKTSDATNWPNDLTADADSANPTSTFTIPANPTRAGYMFKEWTTNSDGTGTAYRAGQNITVTGGNTVNLTAKWEPNSTSFENKVQFRGVSTNATGWPSDLSETKTSSSPASTFTIPANPSRAGYVFKEWTTNSDGTGTAYRAGQNITVSGGNTVILYASWTAESPSAPTAVIKYTKVDHNTFSFDSTDSINAASVLWNFGDSNDSTSTNEKPTHPYESPGSYVVTLTVTSSSGATHTATQTVVVSQDSSDQQTSGTDGGELSKYILIAIIAVLIIAIIVRVI